MSDIYGSLLGLWFLCFNETRAESVGGGRDHLWMPINASIYKHRKVINLIMCTRVWFPPCHLFLNRLIIFFSFWEAPLIDQWGMGKERGVILSRVILVTTSGYMKEEMWHTCGFWKPGWACLNTHTKSTFMSPYRPGRRGRQWPVFPGTKCSLCQPELPRFNGGDCPCSVQRVLRCA